MNKELRRREIVEQLLVTGRPWGVQAKIARNFGVSEATISRDIKAIFERELHSCPTCDRVYERDEWEDLARRGRVVLTEDGVELLNVRQPQVHVEPTPAPASIVALDVLRRSEDAASGDRPVTDVSG